MPCDIMTLMTKHPVYMISGGITKFAKAHLETALRVCDNAIQIHRGYGYIDGYDVHRHWRDARLLTIGEGT